jgi:transposase
MKLRTIGIDLGKTTFHLIGMDERGNVLLRRRFSRTQLITYISKLDTCLIGMEACSGSNILGRTLRAQGHTVRLIPAQFVRPFVKSNKNDYNDAEAIAEAVQKPNMRFVPIKTEDQLDLQAIHRTRERFVTQRTRVTNQIRAYLLERGIVLRTGRLYLQRQMASILEDGEQRLSGLVRRLLDVLWQEWKHLDVQIAELQQQIETIAEQDEACQRLMEIPGIGPLASTLMVAAVGNGSAFHRGRDFSAWLGIVPAQASTGGKPRLLGISKRGNKYLRQLFVHGARSCKTHMNREKHPFGEWVTALEKRSHSNVVSVALANKIARIAWSVLARGERYRAHGPVAQVA